MAPGNGALQHERGKFTKKLLGRVTHSRHPPWSAWEPPSGSAAADPAAAERAQVRRCWRGWVICGRIARRGREARVTPVHTYRPEHRRRGSSHGARPTKAKQTKVARQLKYGGPDTDLQHSRRSSRAPVEAETTELTTARPGRRDDEDEDDVEDNDDPAETLTPLAAPVADRAAVHRMSGPQAHRSTGEGPAGPSGLRGARPTIATVPPSPPLACATDTSRARPRRAPSPAPRPGRPARPAGRTPPRPRPATHRTIPTPLVEGALQLAEGTRPQPADQGEDRRRGQVARSRRRAALAAAPAPGSRRARRR